MNSYLGSSMPLFLRRSSLIRRRSLSSLRSESSYLGYLLAQGFGP